VPGAGCSLAPPVGIAYLGLLSNDTTSASRSAGYRSVAAAPHVPGRGMNLPTRGCTTAARIQLGCPAEYGLTPKRVVPVLAEPPVSSWLYQPLSSVRSATCGTCEPVNSGILTFLEAIAASARSSDF
jgi:hypothetical protein